MEIERDNCGVFSRVVGPMNTSIYVIGCRETKRAAIIDAGADAGGFLETIDEQGWELSQILLTHAHVDHVAGLQEVQDARDVPIVLHRADQPVYEAAVQQGAMFGFDIEPLPAVDKYVEEGDVVNVGNLSARVMLLPGHSPGSVAYYFEDEGLFFGGDVVFASGIGRVDLPGADPEAMKSSLQRVKQLPDDTVILPGHGPTTTVGQEKRVNPFLQPGAGGL